ncbi:1-phosphofructokinase [Clostridium sp. MCC353]|uniref:1-phosphofructokinase n=1 Tax=Clostridium sp. MCC353 TaxID=2592646 RepID=UPI001C017CEE|nr:1-phosphofructokinase [Clostridium sp. MCC353]MBT9776529.1 1-phosphofructokinase [Clostridium sp. MCC353]
MIYTVTFNPALDYVVKVDHFTLGEINRTSEEHIFYGGKGLNVSAILANLGFETTALGFVAGFTGEEIERGAKTLGFHSEFIHVKNGMSRINVKLKSDEETELNGMGPEIMKGDVDLLFGQLDRIQDGDVLVLSGSIPKTISDDIYERIMERLQNKGVRIAVDATRDLLMNVLKYRPFLIKPNNHELGEIFGVELHGEEEVIRYAKKLQELGAGNVLVSMAGDGAVLVTEAGDVHKIGVPKGTVKNSVGAGDSMVAGFLAGYLETGDYGYALKLGTAAGSATAFSDGIGEKDFIMDLLKQIS